MDDISPTPERLRRSKHWDTPAKDRSTDRRAYRVLSAVETLLKRGDIEREHYEAAQKFQKHLLGSMGVDVRQGEGAGDPDTEYPRSYHAQMVAKVAEALTPREYQIVSRLVQDEASPVSIGFGLSGYLRTDASRPYGVSAVFAALDRLSYHFGFKAKPNSAR